MSSEGGKTPGPKRQLASPPAATSTQQQLLTALGHPLRRRILRALHGAGEARSPSELSESLHLPISGVSYHTKVLRDKNAIALTDTRQVRGTLEHFYVSTVTDSESAIQILDSSEAEDEGR